MARYPTDGTPPWKRKNPKRKAGEASTPLTAEQKQAARARARAAGRPYPNLVDNMAVARKRRAPAKKR